jgi:hypothetical protein
MFLRQTAFTSYKFDTVWSYGIQNPQVICCGFITALWASSFLVIIGLSGVLSGCKSKFELFCVKAEVAVNVLVTCGLFGVVTVVIMELVWRQRGLWEFHTLFVFLPAGYLIFHWSLKTLVLRLYFVLWSSKFIWVEFKNSVSTLQEMHWISMTKISRLMLCRDVITV